MNEPSISITANINIEAFPPEVRRTIIAHILSECGGTGVESANAPSPERGDEQGLARLSVADAKLFLNKCSEKTTLILQEIVNRDGDFMVSDIAASVGTDIRRLGGAWAGLTKRVRTITKDAEASLINWFKQGGDWHGIMAAQTVASMRVALHERAN